MDSKNTDIKKVYFKSYSDLSLLEIDIKHIKEISPIDSQITVLGKVTQFCSDKNIEVLKNLHMLKLYWSELLGNSKSFGNFENANLGNVFIGGTLASTFLREINGKTLGMLSAGPYGIIRGMGASELQAKIFLQMLNNDHYLVLFRGFENELEDYKKILE